MGVFIIAEAGINHNGDIATAKKMIDAVKKAGADCIKFQTFKAEEFVSDPSQTYTYTSQGKTVTESMLEMFKRYQFTEPEWKEIIEYCEKNDIVFSSTAQNPSDLDFLLSLTKLPFIKVGSDDLTNLELLEYYGSKQIPMIISAGMAYASEIEDAIKSIKATGNNDITVLHCVSSYPTEAYEVNLKKISTIQNGFDVKVGFSDHTEGNSAAVGSVCFGASVIEKHFTLDADMPGPDHWFSITPSGLEQYVKDIRFMENAIGKGVLEPTLKEQDMRKIARRKIVAKKDLKKDELITNDNVEFKRAEGEGLVPKELKYIINRTLKSDIKKNTIINLKDLK